MTNRKNIYNVCLCLSVPIVRCDEKKKCKKGEIYAKITCERWNSYHKIICMQNQFVFIPSPKMEIRFTVFVCLSSSLSVDTLLFDRQMFTYPKKEQKRAVSILMFLKRNQRGEQRNERKERENNRCFFSLKKGRTSYVNNRFYTICSVSKSIEMYFVCLSYFTLYIIRFIHIHITPYEMLPTNRTSSTQNITL